MMAEAPLPETGTKTMNMIEAINSAMDVMLARDPDVVVLGEDVGYFGGVFRATAGLQKKHGKTRVFDTPITECGIIGVGVGMAAYGLRPVPKSSLPIISIRASISSSAKRRVFAIARQMISPAR